MWLTFEANAFVHLLDITQVKYLNTSSTAGPKSVKKKRPVSSCTVCLFVSVLTIIKLQDDLWDLQKKATNETNVDPVQG